MIGALVGDIIGSCYEGRKCLLNGKGQIVATYRPGAKERLDRFSPRGLISKHSAFTDDSVLTRATAGALMGSRYFAKKYVDYFVMTSSQNEFYRGPGIGYGAKFLEWADLSDRGKAIRPPYFSYGNGAAMRVSPVAYAATTAVEVLNLSLESCVCTHNTPSALKSAQVTALAIWFARNKWSIPDMHRFIQSEFDYDLNMSLDDLIENHHFNPTADGSVPIAIYLALSGTSFVDVMQRCLRVGGRHRHHRLHCWQYCRAIIWHSGRAGPGRPQRH